MNHIRKSFPLIDQADYVYLDSAATSQKPQAVIDAVTDYYRELNANVHRGVYPLAEEATAMYVKAHEKAAAFLNTPKIEEVIFTKNATEGLNLIANLIAQASLTEGDVVVLTEMEHHSNIVPWQILSKRYGFRIEWLPVKEGEYTLDLGYFDFLVRKFRERIKVVSFVHVSNVLGVENNVNEVVEIAKSIDALTILDASQSVPHMELNVRKLDVDFLVFSAHKMYAPTGLGVVYGRKELLDSYEPWLGGGEMISSVRKSGAEWADLPWKFEAGTPNMAGAAGLTAAMDWMSEKLDYGKLHDHENALVDHFFQESAKFNRLKIFGPQDPSAHRSVVSFNLTGIHSHDLASLLGEKGIYLRAGYHCAEPLHKKFEVGATARVSFGPYNNISDIDRLFEALTDVIEAF